MKHRFFLPCALFFLLGTPPLFAGPPADLDQLRQKPITTAQGKIGELLRQWWKEGTAAGNAGDYYDNRDKDHSPLNLAPYPQLSAIKYTAEDEKAGKHWAAQRVLLPHVTFGNSSTSAPPTQGGSNPRMYYTSPLGIAFLYRQYRGNNLYIYPEHRDHDPGHNGKGDGFGDMYPTNTPYLMISQGSSGSDQPFMRMLPLVLASFRPDVKKKLTETGTLMPTIQMLFRSTNKHLQEPAEYLTGKAHPTVFEGSWVNDLAMVQKAHDLELKMLPPLVQMQVIEEGKPANGVDFCDLAGSEKLADTPCCIARIHRTKAYQERLVVNAGASFDINKAPLTYTWVVLRGDPEKIKITPRKKDQSEVEITVAYHDRRPVSPGSPLESNRVDIGLFVHNGVYYSAPGFITFHTLDREGRTYDADGKVLEIAHGLGETDLRVSNWDKLLPYLLAEVGAARRLLPLDAKQKNAFTELLKEHAQLQAVLLQNQYNLKEIEAAAKDAGKKVDLQKLLDSARQGVTKAQKAVVDLLDRKVDALADSPRRFIESRLLKLARDPQFTLHYHDWLKERRTPAAEPRYKTHWQKLVRWGIATADGTLTPLRPGKTLDDARWTRFELALLEACHAALIADLAFPGMLQASYQVNYVDQRLSAPREWRDLYHYDPKGACLGWTRLTADGKQEFNYEGMLIVEKDAKGRCVKARTVRYGQELFKGKGFNPNLLRAVPGDFLVRYEFESDADLLGRRAGTEPARDEKKK